MSENLAGNLSAAARRWPERPALTFGDSALSYGGLDEAAARVAALLRTRGVEPGDRLGIMLPNIPAFAIVYYGALRAGAVAVPLNILFKQREVTYHLGDAQASLLFAWRDISDCAEAGAADAGVPCVLVRPDEFERELAAHEPLAELSGRVAGDTAVILYTSGTTGTPKGAELTHANLRQNAEAARRIFRLDEQSVTTGVLPLFHSFGQTCGLNATIVAGGVLALRPRFDANQVLELIERDRVTVFMGVPTMYSALLHAPDRARFDTTSLELCVSGGAPLPVELLRDFEAAFRCPVIEGYGLSETSPVASFNHPERPRKPGSIGTPIDGVAMKVVDENAKELFVGEVGEIVIRGHNVMKGYWRRPEATAEAVSSDGWFHTGDLGRIDEDGYFFIVDRKKDMIIRGGFNVYPREIEEVLYEHPAVREAAVLGVPHPQLGEEVVAVVSLEPGSDTTEDELREFVKAQVASYKYPRRIRFAAELPKTATGKILKRAIDVPALVTDGDAGASAERAGARSAPTS